jgi:hypothetical protein
VSDYIDDESLPFTYDELHRALRVTCRFAADAKDSADEYARIAADERVGRAAGSPPMWAGPLLGLEVLAALSLQPTAAARVAAYRDAVVLRGRPASFRAEEESYWLEVVERARGWAGRLEDEPPAT